MKKRLTIILIFAAILISSLYFGLPRLKDFSGVDEPYWSYDRVPKFWQSIKDQKWKSTNICDKPGIPLAIISGTGLPFISENIKDLSKLRYEPKTISQLNAIRDIYYKLRFPVFIFTLLALPLFYFLIKKLLGETTANFSLIFIGLSPILLGISLIINSDALLWILTALSTLSLFNFFKSAEKKYLILSGFFLGLSVITKYVANVLFVYYFLLFFLEYIFYAHQEMGIRKYLKESLVNYLALFVTAIATAFVFFPATWVKLSTLLNVTITNDVFKSIWPFFVGIIVFLGIDILALKSKLSEKIFSFLIKYKSILIKFIVASFLLLSALVFIYVYTPLHISDIQGIIASPNGIGEGNTFQQYLGAFSADLYSLFFSISPLILFFTLFLTFKLFREKELHRDFITAIYIIIFIFIFYLGSAINGVVTVVRYQISVYPLAFILAAIGINRFLELPRVKKNIKLPIIYIASVFILLFSLSQIKPNFLAYASEILPHNFIVNLKGMGEGSIEAGNYLNKLPNAHEMTIWSDKGAACESFVGKCYIDFKNKTFRENRFNYFVVSTDRRSRSLKMSNGSIGNVDFEKLYSFENPSFEVIIGGREINFVKVIKIDDILNEK